MDGVCIHLNKMGIHMIYIFDRISFPLGEKKERERETK